MQVFVPFPDLEESVCCLDPKRLGNQIYRECRTLISGGWPNHPASKMWKGYEGALAQYALFGLEELDRRNRYYPHHIAFFTKMLDDAPHHNLPWWWGDDSVHRSHRSNLLRKDPEWYSKFFPNEPSDLPYVWKTEL